MSRSRSVSSLGVVLGSLLLAACSSSDDGGPLQMAVDANRSSAGSGGSASTSAAGSGGSSNAAGASGSTGGSSANEGNGNVGLNAGGSTSSTGNTGSNDAGSESPDPVADAAAPPAGDTTMSFFVTSRGVPTGANFGGLEGADALCTTLASAVSAELGAKDWRAYLSTTTVNARDRIGSGPWFNQAGVIVANNVAQLTDQGAGGTLEQTWASGDATIALDELGNQVPAGGAGGVQHDILTGTLADGTVAAGLTCADWTAVTGNVEIGHSNRAGGGQAPNSWSSAHGAPAGCAPIGTAGANVSSGGGRGSIYCFAAD